MRFMEALGATLKAILILFGIVLGALFVVVRSITKSSWHY